MSSQTTHQAPGGWTDAELHSQPQAWRDTLLVLQAHQAELHALVQGGAYGHVIFTACGSPYYLGLSAAAVTQREVGIPARALPASELWLNPAAAPQGRGLLVALSRSGATTETLRAVSRWRQDGLGDVLTFSGYPEAPLPALGSLNLLFPAAQEESTAQTRAFTVLQLATTALAALWADNVTLWAELQQTPVALERLLQAEDARLTALGSDLSIDRFYFLGSGLRYGLASEASLKMKEMSLSHSEPFHVLEFRHGPKSMVTEQTLVIAFLSPEPQLRAQEEAVLAELRAQGGRTLSVAEADADLNFHSGLGEVAQAMLCVPVAQLVALSRALAKGLNPDSPANLSPYVVIGA
jgi:glucosamine--fructose-6-phosphate aminotransferase (isomerizing)